MYYCGTCKRSFQLVPIDNESTTDFAQRLAETIKTTCPDCGRLCKKCRCRNVKNAN